MKSSVICILTESKRAQKKQGEGISEKAKVVEEFIIFKSLKNTADLDQVFLRGTTLQNYDWNRIR